MKRFLSMILALAMIIAMIPAVFASGETEVISKTYVFNEYAFRSSLAGNDVAEYTLSSFLSTYTDGKWEYLTINEEARKVAEEGGASYNGTSKNNRRVRQAHDSLRMQLSSSTNSSDNPSYDITSSGIQLALKLETPEIGFYRAESKGGNNSNHVQLYLGKLTESRDIEDYTSDINAFYSTTTYGSSTTWDSMVRNELDGIIYSDGEELAFAINIANNTYLRDLHLTKITPDLTYTVENNVLGVNEKTTSGVTATWTENEVGKSQKVLNSFVEYSSNKPEVAKVSATGEITAIGNGTATITATVGGESYTQDINVVDLSGIKVEYDTYVGSNSTAASANLITYEVWSINGRIEYHKTTSTSNYPYSWDQTPKNQMGEGTFKWVAAFELAANSDEYTAYKIRIPAKGDYMASLYYLACNNENAARSGSMYILPPESITDIPGALATATPVLSNVNFYDETNQFKTTEKVTFSAESAGEYLMVWKNTGDTGTRITPVTLTLNGGDGTAPIWANMSVDNAELEVDGTTTLTSNVYMSDGVAATEDEVAAVTYASTNEAVATVSGTTVTATGAGTAKIQAKSGDYVLGEVGVTVSHPKAPTVSFYAESTDNEETPIMITATDADGSPVLVATLATLNRGAEVTVNAPEKEGYLFVGWFRGSKDTGRFVWADNEYTFNAMTHTMLTAVYEVAPEKAYYNFNGEFLGTSEPSADLTMLGYKFDGWNETVYNNLTRFVANYLKDKEKTYNVTIPSEVSVEKDEDAYYYDTKVTLTSGNAVTWLRNEKPVAYGKTYTFYVWDNVTITTDTEADTAPKVILDSSKSGAYMIEYDAGDKTIIEKGIIFGDDTDITVESCEEKMNSQRSEAHGQFTASSDYPNARGYLIYKDGNEYKVIYAD